MVKESLNCLRGIIKESLDPKSQHMRSYNKAKVDLLMWGWWHLFRGLLCQGHHCGGKGSRAPQLEGVLKESRSTNENLGVTLEMSLLP